MTEAKVALAASVAKVAKAPGMELAERVVVEVPEEAEETPLAAVRVMEVRAVPDQAEGKEEPLVVRAPEAPVAKVEVEAKVVIALPNRFNTCVVEKCNLCASEIICRHTNNSECILDSMSLIQSCCLQKMLHDNLDGFHLRYTWRSRSPTPGALTFQRLRS